VLKSSGAPQFLVTSNGTVDVRNGSGFSSLYYNNENNRIGISDSAVGVPAPGNMPGVFNVFHSGIDDPNLYAAYISDNWPDGDVLQQSLVVDVGVGNNTSTGSRALQVNVAPTYFGVGPAGAYLQGPITIDSNATWKTAAPAVQSLATNFVLDLGFSQQRMSSSTITNIINFTGSENRPANSYWKKVELLIDTGNTNRHVYLYSDWVYLRNGRVVSPGNFLIPSNSTVKLVVTSEGLAEAGVRVEHTVIPDVAYTPNVNSIFEDFLNYTPSTVPFGAMGFNRGIAGNGVNLTAVSPYFQSNTVVGLIRLEAGSAIGSHTRIHTALGPSVEQTRGFRGVMTNEWRFALNMTNQLSGLEGALTRIGITDNPHLVTGDAIVLQYSTNDANFVYVSCKSGTVTTNATTLKPTIETFYKFRVVYTCTAQVTNAVLTIDGAQGQTLTAADNIPDDTVGYGWGASIELHNDLGSEPHLFIDYCYLGYELEVSR
jgi:hypothetical protein